MITPTKKGLLRGSDPTGNGWYGASRGLRKHKGVDYLAIVGEPIYASITGKVRIGNVYLSNRFFKLIEITKKETDLHHGYRVKQMYVSPVVSNGQYVSKGDIIGHSQDIASYHGKGMKNHCHVSIWKNGLLTDPEPILKKH